MKNFYKIVIVMAIAAVIFIPFYPIVVVPEWELIFVNKDGTPASSIRISQTWKEYSLEYLSSARNEESGLKTDSNGYIKLPARQIRVSIFQIVSSRIYTLIMSINPHASFGPHSSIICQGIHNCVVSYKNGVENPQRVVLW